MRGSEVAPIDVRLAADGLLPPLFTPMARARLWRPFNDQQRLLAARVVIAHLQNGLSTAISESPELDPNGPFAVRTFDRLAGAPAQRAELYPQLKAAIPSNHLIQAAIALTEHTIDQYLIGGKSLILGNIRISGKVSLDEWSRFAARLDEAVDALTRATWLTRGRLLRRLCLMFECITLTRVPLPYNIEWVTTRVKQSDEMRRFTIRTTPEGDPTCV